MPYIRQQRRDYMDDALGELSASITSAGDLNYAICKLAWNLGGLIGGNYDAENSVMGALDCAAREYYRRVIAPYEDLKIRENGDVFPIRGE